MSFTKLYLTGKTAPFTPTNFRGSWSDTGGQLTRALDVIKKDGGAIAFTSRSETSASNTHSALLYRGVSGPLAAQTISGNLDVVLGVGESPDASADFAYHLHVYVTAGDTDTVRGTLLSDYIETTANEWPVFSEGRALASAQALSSLAISDGDRLVVEIGYRALNSSTSSFTGFLRYGTQDANSLLEAPDLTAGSASVDALAGFLSFSNSITEKAIEARTTQFAAHVGSSGEKQTRVTQFSAVVGNKGTRETRVTQFVAQVATKNDEDLVNIFVAGF